MDGAVAGAGVGVATFGDAALGAATGPGAGVATVAGAFVPAGALDPLAGFAGGDFFADEFDGFADFGDGAEFDSVKAIGFVEMAVGVDEAGSGGAAVEIDDLGIFGSELTDLVVAADGDDFSVVN